jgi:hypothetical protein
MAPQSCSTRSALDGLQRGLTYRATTTGDRVVIGEYLGIEVPFGAWAILLRHETGTESISLDDIIGIQPTAA